MRVISSIAEMREVAAGRRRGGETVGLVPTMGYFHPGHISLMRAAREECDFVAVSLFVNPAQFGLAEDLAAYPRDLARDSDMAEAAGVDCMFCPRAADMYPDPYLTYIEVEGVGERLCGESRPGHFRGVATVVAKLLNIIPAHRAYFGLKDAQQLWVIRKMARDLDFDVAIVACPTVRASDGVALSSRNVYLDAEERRAAAVLYRSLRLAERMAAGGERDPSSITAAMGEAIAEEPLVSAEYIAAVDWESLQPLERMRGEVLIALAARVGKARLIDNVLLRMP